jgi:hypothetical protein
MSLPRYYAQLPSEESCSYSPSASKLDETGSTTISSPADAPAAETAFPFAPFDPVALPPYLANYRLEGAFCLHSGEEAICSRTDNRLVRPSHPFDPLVMLYPAPGQSLTDLPFPRFW